jgi:hypothetical protein
VLSYVGSADPPSKMSKNRFINFRRHSELEKARGPNPNLFFIIINFGECLLSFRSETLFFPSPLYELH